MLIVPDATELLDFELAELDFELLVLDLEELDLDEFDEVELDEDVGPYEHHADCE